MIKSHMTQDWLRLERDIVVLSIHSASAYDILKILKSKQTHLSLFPSTLLSPKLGSEISSKKYKFPITPSALIRLQAGSSKFYAFWLSSRIDLRFALPSSYSSNS